MGVDFNGVKLLLWAKNLGAAFERTLTLGRQGLVCSPANLRSIGRQFGQSWTNESIDVCYRRPPCTQLFADEFFKLLGAKEIVSVDRSDFEGATLLHDLNEPFPDHHRARYDFVFDGGTLEHIFNYPAALRTCIELVRPGGHFLTIAPAHNLMGHGFYQISPELFFRAFTGNNGITLLKIVLFEASKTDAAFFEVNDPAKTGLRTELSFSRPMYLAALAQRTSVPQVFTELPQQSDYVSSWERHAQVTANNPAKTISFFRRVAMTLNPYWPYWLRQCKTRLIYSWNHKAQKLSNKRHFRRLSSQDISHERMPT